MSSLVDTAPITSTPSKKYRSTPQFDRFIPNRGSMDLEVSHFAITSENTDPVSSSAFPSPAASTQEEFRNVLAESLLGAKNKNNKVLAFRSKAPPAREGYQNELRVLYSHNRGASEVVKRSTRVIPQAPERILDAPDLVDDFYLNLLDWSSTNLLAVALGDSVFLWNASTGSVECLMNVEGAGNFVTSVSWMGDGSHLAIGTQAADIQLWDVSHMKQVRTLRGHMARVGSMSWNRFILSSGSRDASIHNHDVRVADHLTATLEGHTQEICGLRWSPDGRQLASGGNDNLLCIYDQGKTTPRFRISDHVAAVKALAWNPRSSNLLASGGGTADRCIKFWNTQTGACLNSIDTKSQVCALQWSRLDGELLSSHGFTQNQLTLWKYPSMVKMADLTGHTARVHHMAQSPDGQTVVSAAPDETLRFWKVFGSNSKASKKGSDTNRALYQGMSIR